MRVDLLSITPNAEALIEEAGRTCYKSKVGDPSIIQKWIKAGHECFDEETEILTDSGFKFFKDLTDEDLVAQIDPQNISLIDFVKPIKIIKEQYEGLMYYFDSPKINLMITPNHRIFASLSKNIKKRIDPVFDFYKCEEVYKFSNGRIGKKIIYMPMRMSTNLNGTNYDNIYNPLNFKNYKAFNKLVGFFIGDGYSSEGNILHFHLKKTRKIEYLKQLCSDLNITLEECQDNKYKVIYKNIGKIFRDEFYNSDKEKIIPYYFLKMSKETIEGLIDGLINSDGSISKRDRQMSFTTVYSELSDMFQILNCIIGKTFSKRKQKISEKSFNTKRDYIYQMNYKSRSKYPHLNDSRSEGSFVNEHPYKGYVYCVNVPSGLIAVRRNNKIVLSGNSVIEHCAATFRVREVSRALTHQLVRHRIGFSYSQQSQRYVDEDQFGYVIPDSVILADKADLYLDFMLLAQDVYNELVKAGVKKEDSRFVLPNACHTEIVVTMNFRAARNFFSLRLDKHAQWEIRKMANRMLRILKYHAPNVFYDFDF